ncbi:L-ascorbate oxidase [Burkholderia sp. 8Y]|uniref:multicopper oxidase family protein n=1 Tax=Burkholderia sp. 8Y TaxID=2653133 RepID=UPI0012F007F6|nr:multicopper oxidase domain-containing protein [Burkholderia sp. 8Y]VXB33219.1 L-ascorbate oxidase [Burkholderia sp. 8Y]
MKRSLKGCGHALRTVLLTLVFVPALCSAQSTLNARSFTDVDDTADATAGNSAVSTAGSLVSILQRLQCASGLNPSGNSATVSLTAKMGSYKIFNPSTNVFDTVNMRSYNGCPSGPTISIKPGATLKLNFTNNLPLNPDDGTCPSQPDHVTPHCFNNTNIHTHGLHVSPSGNADNVLITVPPSGGKSTSASTHQYVYTIPSNHPSGTFWYHSHLHGSTAIDVASGMAGVLIVRGSRPARAGVANGSADIDTILRRKLLGLPLTEHVMLFQQIEYACFSDATSTVPLLDPTTGEWICPSGKVGEIRGYNYQLGFVTDTRTGAPAGAVNSSWVISGRYTQINGVVQPIFPSAAGFVAAGDIRRLRMVHGGNRDTINVKIVRANLSALGLADSQSLSTAQVNTATNAAASALANDKTKTSQTVTLDSLCSGETVKQLEFAEDGITMQTMVEKDVNSMNPGYRSDVLVAFPSPGLYCILDEAASASATINFRQGASKVKDRRLLSFARVGPGVNIPNTTVGSHSKYWQYVRDQLVAANPTLAQPAKTDLQSLSLRAFAPTVPVDGPIKQTVNQQFQITFPTGPNLPLNFMIEGSSYDPSVIRVTGTLGTVDQWNVGASTFATHVFHIHTNPFKIIDIKNAANNSIFDGSGNCTPEELATGDSEYCNLQGVIRDTLFIKAGYTLQMRTAYEDFTGEFVMHCHILDHEDRGMMENVAVVSPTTAWLQRLTSPVTAMKASTSRWLARLRGEDETKLALAASLCSAKDYSRGQ